MNATTDSHAAAARPAGTAPKVFRVPLFWRLFSLVGVIILAAVTAIMIVFAVLGFTLNWAVGLFVMACAFFLGALAGYVWRDLKGKWGLRVVLDADAVTLDLPAGRSLIHRPPAQHVTMPYADIEAIETRLEAYGSLGMETMQRAYALRPKRGAIIFLFEDRALGSGLQVTMFANIAAELTARAGVKLHDLGMVEGRGGFLATWGTHSVDWATPSLPLARQLQLWRHSAITGGLAIAITIIAIVVRLIVGG